MVTVQLNAIKIEHSLFNFSQMWSVDSGSEVELFVSFTFCALHSLTASKLIIVPISNLKSNVTFIHSFGNRRGTRSPARFIYCVQTYMKNANWENRIERTWKSDEMNEKRTGMERVDNKKVSQKRDEELTWHE